MMPLQTYCSLGKVYGPTPGGGDDKPGTDGYLKMAVVCVCGAKVFFDGVLALLVPKTGIVCEGW